MKKFKTMLFLILSIFTTSLITSCSNATYTEKQEYVLEDRFEIYEGVKYYYSSLGMVAKEIVENKEEISIYPKINNELVYSIATDFLKDNNTIKVLNLPNTDIIYESYCVSNCVNLKEINFKDIGNFTCSKLDPMCEKNAFDIEEDCYFYIHNVGEIQHYVYAFSPYVDHFKLLNPLQVVFSLSSQLSGSSNYKVIEKNLSFSVKGELFGIIDIDSSMSYSLGDPWYCRETVKLIDDTDFFIKNHKKIKKQNFNISTNAYILAEKNIVAGIITKDYPVNSNKSTQYEQLYGFSHNTDGEPRMIVSFYSNFSYIENI